MAHARKSIISTPFSTSSLSPEQIKESKENSIKMRAAYNDIDIADLTIRCRITAMIEHLRHRHYKIPVTILGGWCSRKATPKEARDWFLSYNSGGTPIDRELLARLAQIDE